MDKVIKNQFNILSKLARWERNHERYLNLFLASAEGKCPVVYLNSPLLELLKMSKKRIQELRSELRNT